MEVRKIGQYVFVDKRKFFRFKLEGGKEVETKAETAEEAIKMIEDCLEIKLKEAA